MIHAPSARSARDSSRPTARWNTWPRGPACFPLTASIVALGTDRSSRTYNGGDGGEEAAVIGAGGVLALAGASGSLFVSSSASATLDRNLDQLCPWGAGLSVDTFA